MLKITRYKSTLAKLWIKHNGYQAIQVSTAGCDNVSDLVKAVKKELPNQLTAFESNAVDATALEPNLPISSISAAGLSAKSPLIIKAPEKRSKVALVLQSNATIEEKESLLEDVLQAKDREMQDKEREVQDKVALLQLLKEKLQRIESERDFLKGTLDARNILEKYEKRFKDKNLSRTKNWKMHLHFNPALKARLQECDKNIAWHDKVVDIYKHLTEIVHQDTFRLGGGRFLVMIRNNLPEIDVCFIQAIAEQVYGEYVRVNAKADEED